MRSGPKTADLNQNRYATPPPLRSSADVTTHSQPRIAINDEMPVLVDLAAFARALPGCEVSTADGVRQEVPARMVVNAARRALTTVHRPEQALRDREPLALDRRTAAARAIPAQTMHIAVLAA